MGGRTAAADRVVVERGQVVVDEQKVCTSSSAAAAGISCSGLRPERLADASEITGRMRLPPSDEAVAHRFALAAPSSAPELQLVEGVLDERR